MTDTRACSRTPNAARRQHAAADAAPELYERSRRPKTDPTSPTDAPTEHS